MDIKLFRPFIYLVWNIWIHFMSFHAFTTFLEPSLQRTSAKMQHP
uniref:Uncharacterized protein n=1 Tax=Rhizophora mucronata TaxID=61149 RepID=A0A2P2P8A8_RHIMU